MADLGFIATTAPGGASAWPKLEKEHQIGSPLAGKEVVILPDNDHAGRQHAEQVASTLYAKASSVKVIHLPGLPEKGDVSDFISTHGPKGAAEKLLDLYTKTPAWCPPAKGIADAVLDMSELTKIEMPTKKIFLYPWLTEQSITLLSGWRGTGKTWLALSLLDAVSRGERFGPWRGGESVPVLFLDGEMVVSDIQARSKALIRGDGKAAPFYTYSDQYANQLGLSRANLLNPKWRKAMREVLLSKGVKLWVVDNISSLTPGGDENSRMDWAPVNSWLLDLRFAGIASILLHHTGKEGRQRGTSSREDNLDFSIILRTPFDYTPEDGCRFVVSFEKARVRTADAHLIGQTEFKLVETPDGKLEWHYGNVKKQNRVEILRMLDEGSYKQDEIAAALGVSKGTVSKIKSQAIKDGHLTPKCKLTQSGLRSICGAEDGQ